MSRFVRRARVIAAAVAFVAATSALALACNVPVFRFALERWQADAYRAVLFHRGPLDEAQREMIQPLVRAHDHKLANLTFRTVDVNEQKSAEDPEGIAAADDLLQLFGQREFPFLLVQYPEALRIPKPASVRPLARESIGHLLDSPVRQELVRRLAAGETAVWLLLETGEAEKDGPARAMLEQELKKLENELELPKLTESPEDSLLAAAPLRISFSILPVLRTSPAEEALVAMLVGSEPDLAERSDPMVFPVFGRGRALWALIGAGITPQNIYDAAEFLVGPCSCQVKEQNPGFDLLLWVEWDSLLQQDTAFTSVETRSALPPSGDPELVPIPSGAVPAASPAGPLAVTRSSDFNIPVWWIVSGLAAVMALLIGGSVAVQLGRQGGRT